MYMYERASTLHVHGRKYQIMKKRGWKDRASNVVNYNVDSVGSEGGSKKNKKEHQQEQQM